MTRVSLDRILLSTTISTGTSLEPRTNNALNDSVEYVDMLPRTQQYRILHLAQQTRRMFIATECTFKDTQGKTSSGN